MGSGWVGGWVGELLYVGFVLVGKSRKGGWNVLLYVGFEWVEEEDTVGMCCRT